MKRETMAEKRKLTPARPAVLIAGILCLGAGVLVLLAAGWSHSAPAGPAQGTPPPRATASTLASGGPGSTAPAATAIPVRAGGEDRCWAVAARPAGLLPGTPTPAAPGSRLPDPPVPTGGAI